MEEGDLGKRSYNVSLVFRNSLVLLTRLAGGFSLETKYRVWSSSTKITDCCEVGFLHNSEYRAEKPSLTKVKTEIQALPITPTQFYDC